MDITLTIKDREIRGTSPVLLLANWFQFGSGERAVRARVESRMFLWCVSGWGRLRVNGIWREFHPDDWPLLPWRHEIVYEASTDTPFLVAGAHVIPCHSKTAPLVYQVAHQPSDPLANSASRRDGSWPGLEGVVSGRFNHSGDPLARLAAYIVERFLRAPLSRPMTCELVALLLHEIRENLAGSAQVSPARPGSLRRMQEYVLNRLDGPITIASLAKVGGCSAASVHRQFRAAESLSPGQWVTACRVSKAGRLLRTTSLSIREIGEQVGFEDPFHFSRLFKRQQKLSPRAYRQSCAMI